MFQAIVAAIGSWPGSPHAPQDRVSGLQLLSPSDKEPTPGIHPFIAGHNRAFASGRSAMFAVGAEVMC